MSINLLEIPAADTGYKESEGKLSYEFDWEFIESMAKRMSKNKSKYGPYNWKKPHIRFNHISLHT